MANHLKMAKVQTILTLRSRGWSFRRIGRELGVDRGAVRRHVRLAEAGAPRAKPLPGWDVQNQPNPPTWAGPLSTAEPYREVIEAKLERGLSYQRIWQDLRSEHGFDGSYDSVKRFARRLKAATPLPFRRMEGGPGEEAQVDFGTGAPICDPDGKRRRTHVLRIVLSHSRSRHIRPVTTLTDSSGVRSWHKSEYRVEFRARGAGPGSNSRATATTR